MCSIKIVKKKKIIKDYYWGYCSISLYLQPLFIICNVYNVGKL